MIEFVNLKYLFCWGLVNLSGLLDRLLVLAGVYTDARNDWGVSSVLSGICQEIFREQSVVKADLIEGFGYSMRGDCLVLREEGVFGGRLASNTPESLERLFRS